ncbi:MAG TPA: hypothetical protein VFJ74_17325 [Gemmatimonadaceae bacterium]|nr:hypothetical protein [Gemmatimonadaceae bacterium]
MDASFNALQRSLSERLPGARMVSADGAAALEVGQSALDAPRIAAATLLEGHALRAVRIDGDPTVGFAAFLDGSQRSRVLGYHDGLPLVLGVVAAVVRVRANRRMTTWPRGPHVERWLYAPCAYLDADVCAALNAAGVERGVRVVDTTAEQADGERPSRHPLALLERALTFVQHDRERVERALAEEWCTLVQTPIFIDGGIQQSELVASAPCAVGVVKSHRTLYVDGDALRTVLALKRGQRSSVFRIASARRRPVASWYLRLRDPAGHDPMWGLVRVEACDRAAAERPEALTERADQISRWILAETSPLALPDGRWDRMVYGVRDCEEFLRAVS